MYRRGGWYFDISVTVLNGISIGPSVDFITFLDLPQYSLVTYACSNGIIYSKKNSLILEEAINESLKNIRSEIYGQNSLSITGPIVLGRAVAKHQSALNVIPGTFADLTPGMKNKNRAFIFSDGQILALHKKGSQGGDLESLGAVGTNNYAKIYADRTVFDSSISVGKIALMPSTV